MRKLNILLAILIFSNIIFSQDFSKVDLSKLTPEQVEMYKKYMSSRNSGQSASAVNFNTVSDRKVIGDSIKSTAKPQTKIDSNQVFGAYLFNSQQLTFEPKLNIATPSNYVLGTNDELIVDVSGLYEANYRLKVSPEGTVRVPNVGPVKVAGKSIQSAASSIRSAAVNVFQGLSEGQTHINVTLGDIRSIRVSIIGNVVRPGTYTLPSLATAFNALYACGGPSENGSMRQVKIIRGGKQIAEIDIYKFLTDGVLSNNVLLHDEDVIKVDPYKLRVSLRGAIKNTGKFEGVEGETLKDLLRYAGGFTDSTYTDIATLVRISGNQKVVVDIASKEFAGFKLKSGDDYYFSTIADKFKNKIEIIGAVNRPGVYALENGLTVTELIKRASGLKDDAFMNLAIINRRKADLTPEMINFSLADVLSGKTPDIELKRDDRVEIRTVTEQREGFKVSISGEVKLPGTYALVENLTLMDLILKAKGFTENALTDSIELIRIIKDPVLIQNTGMKSITRKFKIDKNLKIEGSDAAFVLENGDKIVVRKIPGIEPIRVARIEGEILRPGDYNITSKNEYISDLIKRSGGLTKYAYTAGAFLIRNPRLDAPQIKMNGFLMDAAKSQISKSESNAIDATTLQQLGLNTENGIEKVDSIQQKLSGNDIVEKITNTEGLVGINLKEIMRNPHGKFDIYLEEGDLIYIPRKLQTVRVMGEVFFPTYVRFDQGLTLKDYLSNAGGATSKAQKKRIFVLYPNGTSKSTTSFLGIRIYPKVTPGTQILVPRKQVDITQKMSAGETISVLTSITSAAALVYSIISNVTK